jgi:SAM-dependent methyltransferase
MEEIVYHTNYKLEDTYWWFVARNKIVLDQIRHRAELPDGATVLDIGCGTGGFSKQLDAYYQTLCLDVSQTALSYTAKRGLSRLFNCTLQDFPYKEICIDAAVALDVTEHIEDDVAFVKRIYDILPKGGWLFTTVPAHQWLWSAHDEMHQHKRRYSIREFARLLKNSGFEIEFISYINFFLFLPAVLSRFLKGKKKTEKHSPVDEVPSFINTIFKALFSFERLPLRWLPLPFGLSILTVARKK